MAEFSIRAVNGEGTTGGGETSGTGGSKTGGTNYRSHSTTNTAHWSTCCISKEKSDEIQSLTIILPFVLFALAGFAFDYTQNYEQAISGGTFVWTKAGAGIGLASGFMVYFGEWIGMEVAGCVEN